jgi:hypothetical protein
MTCSMIYLLPSILISCSAYRLILTIVAFLSNEDKKSSSEDMGESTYLRRRVSCIFQPPSLHAAPYLSWQWYPGDSIEHSLIAVLDDFDAIKRVESSL